MAATALPLCRCWLSTISSTLLDTGAGSVFPSIREMRDKPFCPSPARSVAFVTGRRESDRNSTAANLLSAGYGTRCKRSFGGWEPGAAEGLPDKHKDAFGRPQRPCYVALHLREMEDDRFASVVKPERRAELEDEGYVIYGNFGDQFSDLDGAASAPHSFKLPNPAYLIL